MSSRPTHLASTHVRLRSDGSAELLAVDVTFWQRLARGELGSFAGESLAALHDVDTDWPNWEMHPKGDELVCLLSGAVTFVLEEAGGPRTVELRQSGELLLVPRGVWHTARVRAPARLLFVTPGEGTQHR
jgi:mannose-6-phosphate isomerase-like protein (cupin superfamily)